jgi:hypothetical protein
MVTGGLADGGGRRAWTDIPRKYTHAGGCVRPKRSTLFGGVARGGGRSRRSSEWRGRLAPAGHRPPSESSLAMSCQCSQRSKLIRGCGAHSQTKSRSPAAFRAGSSASGQFVGVVAGLRNASPQRAPDGPSHGASRLCGSPRQGELGMNSSKRIARRRGIHTRSSAGAPEPRSATSRMAVGAGLSCRRGANACPGGGQPGRPRQDPVIRRLCPLPRTRYLNGRRLFGPDGARGRGDARRGNLAAEAELAAIMTGCVRRVVEGKEMAGNTEVKKRFRPRSGPPR